MTYTTKPVHEDPPEEVLERYAEMVREEATTLLDLLATAREIQWEPSPVPSARPEPAAGFEDIANPTAAIALDPRRLAVREASQEAMTALRDAAIRARAASQALRRALERFEGEAANRDFSPSNAA